MADKLIAEIESAFNKAADELGQHDLELFERFRELLSSGQVRAAEKRAAGWHVNAWVKKGILLGFRLGRLHDYSLDERFRFFDKSTYPLKKLSIDDGVRQVPGGSSIREGAFVAPGVVIMPPAYINVGAYVDANTMVDSHALVGSCAQVGKRVHLSAGAQLGGVLEPIGSMPVIIEDDVMVGGNCGIFDGTIVSERAVLGAGTILTGSTPVYDLVKGQVIRGTRQTPLVIPRDAVVVPGSRRLETDFARQHGLSVYAPVIVKYRDEKTAAATALEDALR